jgi:hypothetical protein
MSGFEEYLDSNYNSDFIKELRRETNAFSLNDLRDAYEAGAADAEYRQNGEESE